MKLTIALLSAAVAVSSAQPHRHAHQHLHEKKRDMVDVDAATEVVYVLNGHAISESEVQEGLKNGTLVLANNGALSSASSPAWTPSSTVAPTTYAAPSTTETPTTSAVPTTTSSSSVYTPPPSSTWTPSSAAFQEAVHTPKKTRAPMAPPPNVLAIMNDGGKEIGGGNHYCTICRVPHPRTPPP